MTIFLKVSHEVLLFILVFFLSFQYPSQILGKDCTSLNKVPICHKGGGVHEDHKGVSICVDFGALWGHIAQHPHDQIGECAVNIEENLKVWACNAGLRHQDHSDSLCFDMNQGGVQVPNCNTSGDSLPQSLFSFYFFSYEIGNYNQGNLIGIFSSADKTAGQVSFEQASNSQGKHILNPDKGVTFKLGSERFGSQYFIDLCWEILDITLKDEPLKVDVNFITSS